MRLAIASGVLVLVLVAAGCRPPVAARLHRPAPAVAHDAAAVVEAPRFMPDVEPGRVWETRSHFRHLRFQNPTFALVPPRNPALWFIGEREGRLLAAPNRMDVLPADVVTVLDLRARTLGWQDCGLLNMAFHPEFGKPGSPNRGFIYVWYNHSQRPHPGPRPPLLGHPSANRLSRFTIPDGSLRADPASELVLIEQQRTNTDHQGGGMFFHPEDGFLYLGVGDGGHPVTESRDYYFVTNTDDPQRLDHDLLAGALRIDVDRRGGGVSHAIRRQPRNGHTQGYFVPSNNPWLDPAGGLLEEFFAIGLRNPHRMTYDPGTRRIFAGDVGEGRIEEVDVVERGANYQWSFLEGSEPYRPRPEVVRGVEKGPLSSWHHRGAFSSIVGGVVYRGRAFPELVGRYLFGDNATGEVFTIAAAAEASAARQPLLRLPQEMTAYGGLSSFAVDADGEIYLCVLGQNERATGTLQRLVKHPPAPAAAPPTLSATGLFASVEALQPHAALFPYEVNASFWSDYKVKTRWLHVPPQARIGFRPEGDWSFPPGTVAVKHFDLEIDERVPGKRRRLETRVLVLDGRGGAYGRLYKWRADQREADLLEAPVTERLTTISRRPWGTLLTASYGGAGAGAHTSLEGGRLAITAPPGGSHVLYVDGGGDLDVAASFGEVAGGAAGLMVRAGAGAEEPYLFLGWQAGDPATGGGDQRLRIERRDRRGGAASVTARRAPGPWIRLARAGGRLAAFTGEDGTSWTALPDEALGGAAAGAPDFGGKGGRVGLAVTSAGRESAARAVVGAHVRCETRDHYYPSNDECMGCHNEAARYVLGASTRQWNREVETPDGRMNQLVLASRRGLLDAPVGPEQPRAWKRMVAIDDAQASLEDRVRSYVDANCSQCHRPGGVVQVVLDARYDVPLERQGLLRGPVRWPGVRLPDQFIVAPRDPERSALHTRVRSRRMPPLGGVLVNEPALSLLREWIRGLEGPPVLAPVRIARAPGARGRVRITLEHPDPAAAVHYTTDGSAPGTGTPRYRQPFEVSGPATLRVAAFRDGHVKSPLVSETVSAAAR